MALLLELRHQRGMTVIVASHDPVIAARCDRIVQPQDGCVVDDVEVSSDTATSEVLAKISRLDPRA